MRSENNEERNLFQYEKTSRTLQFQSNSIPKLPVCNGFSNYIEFHDSLFGSLQCDFEPPHWTEKLCYNYKNYASIPLHSNSTEYKNIFEDFQNSCICYNLSVKEIKRIQHPFAYFTFKIRSQHILSISGNAKENRVFVPIPKSVFEDDLITYNMDFRRIKSPKTRKDGYVVIVMKILIECVSDSLPINLAEIRECEKYPEYVIHLVKDNRCYSSACIPKYTKEFKVLADIFPQTRQEMFSHSFYYPQSKFLNHVKYKCNCSNCLMLKMTYLEFDNFLPFMFTEEHVKFWNIVLNY